MNKTTFQIYGIRKTRYYGFLPQGSSYILSQVNNSSFGYFYGYFTGYTETGVVTTKNHLVKINSNLTIDNSFDIGTGFDQILYTGSSILEQPDGKLIVTGTYTTYQSISANRIIRLNTDGSRDTSFVIGTGFDNYTQVPSIDSLNRIIVPGFFNNYNGTYSPKIARLNIDGSIDTTLNVGSGFNNTTISTMANSDNSIIVTGYFTSYNGVSTSGGIVKIDQYGVIDTSFVSGTGFNLYAYPYTNYLIRIPGESSFYATGRFTSYNGVSANRIIKINQDGTIDSSFNSGTGFNGSTNFVKIIWGNKLFMYNGGFTSYNETIAMHAIILNSDGSILYAPDADYDNHIIIGDVLFGEDTTTGHLLPLFNYIP